MADGNDLAGGLRPRAWWLRSVGSRAASRRWGARRLGCGSLDGSEGSLLEVCRERLGGWNLADEARQAGQLVELALAAGQMGGTGPGLVGFEGAEKVSGHIGVFGVGVQVSHGCLWPGARL
jgi:hypothetical protein